jgi:tetratricopeptide (TPR) repeat protein
VDAGEAYKRKGNDAFRRRRFDDAVDAYSAALDAPVSYRRLVTEQPRRATYHCNRAAAYLARGATPSGGSEARDTRGLLGDADLGDERLLAGVEGPSGPSSSVSSSVASVASTLHAKAALMDCDSALELAPSHVKANFRRAQALWRLGRREEALEAATRSFRAAETEAEEREARALAEAIEAGPWRRPGEKVEGEGNDEETTGMNPRDDGDEPPGTGAGAGTGTGTGAGTLLAASLGAGRSPEEETRRASFVSAAASALEAASLSLGGEEGAGGAGGSGARGGGAERGRGRARDGRGRRVRSRLTKDALKNGFRREGENCRLEANETAERPQ